MVENDCFIVHSKTNSFVSYSDVMFFEIASYELVDDHVPPAQAAFFPDNETIDAVQQGFSQFYSRPETLQEKRNTRIVKRQQSSKKSTQERVRNLDKLTASTVNDVNATSSDTATESHGCQQCNKSFSLESSLKKHIILKHNRPTVLRQNVMVKGDRSLGSPFAANQPDATHGCLPFACMQCHEKYSTLSALEAHMEVHMCSRPYKCSLCNKSFSLPTELGNHVKAHSEPKPFKCDLCSYVCSRSCDMTQHRKQGHRSDKPHKCSVCRKNFRSLSDLEFHMLYHGEKPYRCSHCDFTSNSFDNLRQHMQASHSVERRYKCPLCDWKFKTRGDLKRHLVSKHDRKMCSRCDMLFENNELLKSHMQEHNNGPSDPCPHCNKTFSNDGNLIRHIRSHDRRRSCTECSKTFFSEDAYKKHLERHSKRSEKVSTSNSKVLSANDDAENLFVCNECGKKFRTKNILLYHMCSHVQKPYGCCNCGSKFKHSTSLQNHIASHPIEDVMLKCMLCDEQFAQCFDVEKHVLSLHTGNFKCEKCDEILWTIKHLTSHKKSHAAEISCTFCP